MLEERRGEVELLKTGAGGVAELFSRHRDQLRRAIRFRLDPRIAARVDCEDILQEAYLEVSRRVSDFIFQPAVPFFVWARQITMQVLIDTERKHLGAKMRDVKLEVPLSNLNWAQTNSSELVVQLLGNLTSPSQAAVRDEVIIELRTALERMNDTDREVLVLRHLEELSNKEVAEVLGIEKSAASRRYLRAIERLRIALSKMLPDQ